MTITAASKWIVIAETTITEDLNHDRIEHLANETGATISYDEATRHLTATVDVTATTVNRAVNMAGHLRRALGGRLDALRVVSLSRLEQELAQPAVPELVGTTEAAHMLGVSRQRVTELSGTRKDFPREVARLAAGPVYTRASIEAFNERWTRRRTGRPRKTA